MEKAIIFIDGGYLNRILKTYFDATDIDYSKFCEIICNDLTVNRLRTYYYHCLPIIRKGNKEDEKRYSKMRLFLLNLKRKLTRSEIKLGKLQLIGGQFRQKMTDVLMSLDIVKKSIGKEIKHIILVAGDADFIPAIKTAKDYDRIVHLYYHPSSVHNELLDETDESHPISKEFIDKCKI